LPVVSAVAVFVLFGVAASPSKPRSKRADDDVDVEFESKNKK